MNYLFEKETPLSVLSESISVNGFAAVKSLCENDLTESLLDLSSRKLKEQLAALGDRKIGIGSAAGYKEICQRSKGRWDIPIELSQLGVNPKQCPWWPLVAQVLGEDAVCCFQGIISSEPDSPDQEWHIDSPHTEKTHTPANLINVLIALEDIDEIMGPTQVAVGTHKFSNHLSNPNLVSNELVYQCNKTSPSTLQSSEHPDTFQEWSSPLARGSVLFFDDRLLHRGQANRSRKVRHVAYFSYRRQEYNQNTYFETERSLG